MTDITSKEDIVSFVDQFYNDIQADDLIGPIFLGKIKNDEWPVHLEKMYSFWNSVLFGQSDYRGNPFSHHISLGLEKNHFDRWIALFTKTITDNFQGPKASEAIIRAGKMRLLFESKLAHIKANPNSKRIL